MAEKIDNDELNDFLKYALKLHQSGELAETESCYQQLLSVKPNWPDVQHLFGILLAQQGRYEEALPHFIAARQQQPQSPTYNNSLGNLYRHLGQYDQALEYLQQALELQPDAAATHNNLGILLQKQQRFTEAAQHYEKALALKADYADAHFNLSTVLTQQENYQAAISHLKKALELQPQHLQAQAHLGQLLLQQDRAAEAIEHYKVRLKYDPDHIESHHQLAVAYTKQNQFDAAIAEYKATLKLQPNHSEALHNLGALYVVNRQPELARQCFLQLLAIQPDLDAYYNLGVIYSYQDRLDEAIYYLQEALKLSPDYFNALVNLGAVYLKKEDLSKAAEFYQQALALRPQDPELLYILAAITRQSLPTSTPPAYISHLFDEYAPHFEQHLLEHLQYQVPQLLVNRLDEVLGAPNNNLMIMDLGCGTGLCGEVLRPFAKELIGVDLSEKMLGLAAQKNIYDELFDKDITEILPTKKNLDLIVAGDVFGYVGDLTEIFKLVHQALGRQGKFIFTVEKTEEFPFILQANARFAHHIKYISNLTQSLGFSLIKADEVILRTQKQQAVSGWLLVLRKA